jgi:hypothetical protein
MSVILTVITPLGVIHLADSLFNNPDTGAIKEGNKIFAVEPLNAAFSFAGINSIGGMEASEWFRDFIYRQTLGPNVLADFAGAMKNELEAQMSEEEKTVGIIIHLAGYNENNVPVFYHIRNLDSDAKGDYVEAKMEFGLDENILDSISASNFNHDEPLRGMLYINGILEARQVLLDTINAIGHFNNQMWTSERGLVPPTTIEGLGTMLKAQFQLACALYNVSNRSEIGPPIRCKVIPNPAHRQ